MSSLQSDKKKNPTKGNTEQDLTDNIDDPQNFRQPLPTNEDGTVSELDVNESPGNHLQSHVVGDGSAGDGMPSSLDPNWLVAALAASHAANSAQGHSSTNGLPDFDPEALRLQQDAQANASAAWRALQMINGWAGNFAVQGMPDLPVEGLGQEQTLDDAPLLGPAQARPNIFTQYKPGVTAIRGRPREPNKNESANRVTGWETRGTRPSKKARKQPAEGD